MSASLTADVTPRWGTLDLLDLLQEAPSLPAPTDAVQLLLGYLDRGDQPALEPPLGARGYGASRGRGSRASRTTPASESPSAATHGAGAEARWVAQHEAELASAGL